MIKDIYIRNPSDPNYVYGVLEHHSAVERIISKVKIILGTTPGKVLGDQNFGVGVEDLVFETRVNRLELERKIKGQIDQYITEAAEYRIEPRVSFGKSSEGYDYALIDVFINAEKVAGLLVK